MSEQIRGMVVYHRTTFKRGKITAFNQFTGQIAVAWDDGSREFLNVSELMSEKLYEEFKEQERVDKMALDGNATVVGTTVYAAGKVAPLTKGKVVGHGEKNLVFVEWENGSITKVDAKKLISEADGVAENARLIAEAERLEREFEEVSEQCNQKLEEAAKLIREAASIANKKGVELQDMDAVYSLHSAMDAAGWNTSSWSC